MYVQPIQISPKLLSITICLPRYLTTSTACYVFLRKMSPKNWGHSWGQHPPKRAYSAPYKWNSTTTYYQPLPTSHHPPPTSLTLSICSVAILWACAATHCTCWTPAFDSCFSVFTRNISMSVLTAVLVLVLTGALLIGLLHTLSPAQKNVSTTTIPGWIM